MAEQKAATKAQIFGSLAKELGAFLAKGCLGPIIGTSLLLGVIYGLLAVTGNLHDTPKPPSPAVLAAQLQQCVNAAASDYTECVPDETKAFGSDGVPPNLQSDWDRVQAGLLAVGRCRISLNLESAPDAPDQYDFPAGCPDPAGFLPGSNPAGLDAANEAMHSAAEQDLQSAVTQLAHDLAK